MATARYADCLCHSGAAHRYHTAEHGTDAGPAAQPRASVTVGDDAMTRTIRTQARRRHPARRPSPYLTSVALFPHRSHLVGPIYHDQSDWWFINWVDDAMRPFIPISLRTETYLPFRVPGYGLIIALVALTLLGFLTAGFVGRTFVEFGENLLNRMPIVRPIYKTMKQIFETLFSNRIELRQGGGRNSDRHVVGGVRRPPPSADMAARLPATNMCRASCRARRTRPPGSFSTHRADRARHHGRAGDDLDLSAGSGAAQQRRRAEEFAALIENGRAARIATAPAAPPTTQVNARKSPPCPQQPDRLVALEQIEQMARPATWRGEIDRARASARRRRGPVEQLAMKFEPRHAKARHAACRVPSRSPSPRSRRSSSAMRKPSSVSRMMASRAPASLPSGAR